MVAIIDADVEKVNTVFSAKIKEDGRYSFSGVPPGKYRIAAYEEGDLLWSNEDVEDIGEFIESRDHETLTKDLKKHPMPGVK